jgi:hypothetical protein
LPAWITLVSGCGGVIWERISTHDNLVRQCAKAAGDVRIRLRELMKR